MDSVLQDMFVCHVFGFSHPSQDHLHRWTYRLNGYTIPCLGLPHMERCTAWAFLLRNRRSLFQQRMWMVATSRILSRQERSAGEYVECIRRTHIFSLKFRYLTAFVLAYSCSHMSVESHSWQWFSNPVFMVLVHVVFTFYAWVRNNASLISIRISLPFELISLYIWFLVSIGLALPELDRTNQHRSFVFGALGTPKVREWDFVLWLGVLDRKNGLTWSMRQCSTSTSRGRSCREPTNRWRRGARSVFSNPSIEKHLMSECQSRSTTRTFLDITSWWLSARSVLRKHKGIAASFRYGKKWHTHTHTNTQGTLHSIPFLEENTECATKSWSY